MMYQKNLVRVIVVVAERKIRGMEMLGVFASLAPKISEGFDALILHQRYEKRKV